MLEDMRQRLITVRDKFLLSDKDTLPEFNNTAETTLQSKLPELRKMTSSEIRVKEKAA
jgi:hypothetical protein